MAFWEKIKILNKHSPNNKEFINTYIGKYQHLLKQNIYDFINTNVLNSDLQELKNFDEIIEKYKNNNLITTRLGCVESGFLTNYFYKTKIDNQQFLPLDCVDKYMKENAGLYYKNEADKQKVLDWWCEQTNEIIYNSVITSCYAFLHIDLLLWSNMNIKGNYYNWGPLHKIILQHSENKKILYIGNGVESIKVGYERGLQNAWNFPVSKFSLNYYKTPQTTINMDYPDNDMIETTNRMAEEIVNSYSDFDTAILGCGAYGPPLTNILSKKLPNKNFVYLGSDCYKMFGIYSDGMPIPRDNDVNKDGWMQVVEQCDPRCRNIDAGKYWK
jgi:hypothetical protein